MGRSWSHVMPVSQREQTGVFSKFLSGIFLTTGARPQLLSAVLIMRACLIRNSTERFVH